MTLDSNSIIIVIAASILSGMGTALVNGIRESKKEKNRRAEREQDMLKMAYKAVNASHEDMNNGDLRSQEGHTIHKTSPVAKPKKNKYGV